MNIKDRKKRQQKYKYSFNSKLYDVNMNTSFDEKIGVSRFNPQSSLIVLQKKSKSNSSLTF